MDNAPLKVSVTDAALSDIHELDDYWASRGEPERGERYVRDLILNAESQLTDPSTALRGRIVRAALLPGTREILVFKSSYRIIYRIDETAGIVHVLRFWHSHRDEPDHDR